jgi:hypothetical protein
MKENGSTPEDFYANANTWMNVAKVASYAVVTLLSDLVLVGYLKFCVVPSLTREPSSTGPLQFGEEITGSSSFQRPFGAPTLVRVRISRVQEAAVFIKPDSYVSMVRMVFEQGRTRKQRTRFSCLRQVEVLFPSDVCTELGVHL